MIDLLSEHAAALTELCKRYHVKTLEIVGSATTDKFDPASSDLDFLVDFLPLAPSVHSDAYFDLWFALQDLFGRDVDLVETPAVKNPYFLKAITPQRRVLYAA